MADNGCCAEPAALLSCQLSRCSQGRGRGFAKALLTEALNRAWAADCFKAMLLSGSRQPETHRFYESCGFRSDDKTGFVARPLCRRPTIRRPPSVCIRRWRVRGCVAVVETQVVSQRRSAHCALCPCPSFRSAISGATAEYRRNIQIADAPDGSLDRGTRRAAEAGQSSQ